MYRVIYSKEGLVKFISHLDLVRVWQRAFRRAGLGVKMSQGFSPHPLISFGPPLPVGVAGLSEALDVELLPPRPGRDAIKGALRQALPKGIGVKDVYPVPGKGESLCAAVTGAQYEVDIGKEREGEVREKVVSALGAREIIMRKKTARGEKYRDIKPLIKEMEVSSDSQGRVLLRCTLSVGEGGTLNCRDLLAAILDWPEDVVARLPATRTALFSRRGFSGNRPRIRRRKGRSHARESRV